MDEDYEAAAMYKKKILQLKGEEMTVERLKDEYLNNEPTLLLSTLLEMMNKIDPVYTKSFLESQVSQLQGPVTESKKIKVVN